jgi:type IV secretion system protein TrbI
VTHLPVTTPAWPKEDVKPEPNVEPKRTVVRVHPPKKIKRAGWVTLTNETLDLKEPPKGAYVLPAWTYLACALENVLVSEIEDKFTVTLTRPVWDATGSVILIPQGQRIGAQAKTAELLLNNERIPAFALSYSLPNGEIVDLGAASIMDAAGTSGLTGEVDNHWWVLVWTSIFSGGLQGGQQVLQTQLGNDGVGPIAPGITRQGSLGTQMRLGRAQDTRPTITASAGELCQILVPRAVKLPAYAALVR